MKKLLVIVNVWGRYQEYIPLFCLSWIRAYPFVDIRIYINDIINVDVLKQLEMINALDHVTIVERSARLVGLTDNALRYRHISACIRWLMYEPIFDEYEALYIGDVDIIIAKEEEALYDQHIRHSKYLGLPYSNIIRIKRVPHSLRPYTLAKNIY